MNFILAQETNAEVWGSVAVLAIFVIGFLIAFAIYRFSGGR